MSLKLEREFGEQILSCLNDETVIEIMLNPNGVLWVERFGHSMARLGEMSPHDAEAAMATLAAMNNTTHTRDNPILECDLPLDGSRFQGLIPPVVSAPSFCIRRRATKIFTLDDYVDDETLSARQKSIICTAIEDSQNILIVGGTGSGKTTLINAVIDHIARKLPEQRLIILEDVPEIQCTAENHVLLRTSRTITLLDLAPTTMRYRPDRIIVGEVRGGESLELLKAWNTGHPGGVCTIHANSALSGLERLENLVAEAVAAPMQRTIATAINLIIFIQKSQRTKSRREVRELVRVLGFDGARYITEKED